jgi:hypothetical protein
MLFQSCSDVDNKVSHLWANLTRVRSRDPWTISIPIRIPRLVSKEPFEEPILGSPHLAINRDRGFPLQILFDSHLSQGFLFHWITPWVGLLRAIITQFHPKGNRWVIDVLAQKPTSKVIDVLAFTII